MQWQFLIANVRPQRHVHQPAKQLSCATFNVRSLPKKLEALKQLTSDLDIPVLCLTETWLDDDSVDLRRLRTQGYQVLERARPRQPQNNTRMARNTNHGGVAIIAPNEIRLTKLSVGSPQSFEHLCARVTSKGSSLVILLLYRPGSTAAKQEFFNELSSMLESLAVLTDPVVVTGDINIRLDRPSDPLCTQFTNIIESFGFTNHVSQPTHDMGGILDAVITRSDLPAPTIDVIDTGLSDHRLIKWSTDLRRPPPIYVTETRRSWKHFQVDEFRSAIQKSPLCDMDFITSLDADQLANVYDNVIASILIGWSPFAR